MPVITLDILAKRQNDLVTIKIEYNNQFITSSVFYDEINTPQKAVRWAINRKFITDEIVTDIQKRITATVHLEIDPDGDYWVIDSIDSVEPLPEDNFDSWVDTNVVDLASARDALKTLASYVRKLR